MKKKRTFEITVVDHTVKGEPEKHVYRTKNLKDYLHKMGRLMKKPIVRETTKSTVEIFPQSVKGRDLFESK